jgi:hypothetical protein
MEITRQKPGSGSGEGKKYIGIFSAKVIAVNPDRATIASIYGTDVDPEKEEIKYESSKDGVEQVQIVPWVEADTPEKQKFRIPHYITDQPMVWPTSKKNQYVSSVGDNATADSEENLQDWFRYFTDFKTKEKTGDKIVRHGLSGEADWYKFLKPWLSKVKFSDPATNILFDSKKLFRNVDKYVNDEYRSHLLAGPDETYIGNVVILAYVVTKEKDGQLVQQQKFWSEILPPQVRDNGRPVDTMKVVNIGISTGNWGPLKKWVEKITDTEHGCKGHYKLEPLQPFVEGDFQAAGSIPFVAADGTTPPVVDNTSY